MPVRYFLTTLFAVNLSFHLLRFPHLILENGGGAFLILFFLALNFLALPLIISEKIMDRKLSQIDLRSLLGINKNSRLAALDSFFFFCLYGLRLLVLSCFLFLFLFISTRSIHYLVFFLGSLLTPVPANDLASTPDVEMSGVGAFFWVSLSFFVFARYRKPFLDWSNQWGLPCCFALLFVLFLKIILSVPDYEALKILFYPDFSALTGESLNLIIGHSMASLFIGLGFYKLLEVDVNTDLVEIFINAIIQALILAILIGVMALPMIDQFSETAFGSQWIFSILPRWLSYGTHGLYYSALFFLAMSYLSFHVSVTLWRILNHNTLSIVPWDRRPKLRLSGQVVFVVLIFLALFLMQKGSESWEGQSLILSIERIVIDFGLPLMALMILWFVFRYTRPSEQNFVFAQQNLLYHNRFFFQIWRMASLGLVPLMIFLGWLF